MEGYGGLERVIEGYRELWRVIEGGRLTSSYSMIVG
jgi:hypothetical protein